MYEKPLPQYAAEHILQILLDPHISASRIWSEQPACVEESSTYVINITKFADPEEVKNDNFGSWNHSGSHPTT